jgi:ABC-type branched-subunit amino acid transport system permease subunit
MATGLIVGAMLAFFVFAAELVDMRSVLINVSPGLLEMLTLQKPASQVTLTIIILGALLGGLGASIFHIPPRIRVPLVVGLSSVVSLGMLRDMVRIVLSREGWPSLLLSFLVQNQGLSIAGAITIFIIAIVLAIIWPYLPAMYDKAVWIVVTYVPRVVQLLVCILFAITLAMRIFWFIAINDKDLPLLPSCQTTDNYSDVGLSQCMSILSKDVSTTTDPLGTNFATLVSSIITVSEMLVAAGIVLSVIFVLWQMWQHTKSTRTNSTFEDLDKALILITKRKISTFFGITLLVSLPILLGVYPSEVLVNVGLYMLMGFGLNIVVGMAGLLDLGYVAFFAVGAYSTALLTSPRASLELGMSFWTALPLVILITGATGLLVGAPVLRMRGDYLAIVTLGFGEIARFVFLSDWFKPWLGGAQGIIKIPPISIGNIQFIGPHRLYYLVIVGCLIALFISARLRGSRVGRAWMAMSEDEQVAETMGINTVYYKLLAFGLGAMIASISGAIFAAKLGTIFPHSFNVLVSITALSLLIVGGIGSLPGIIVGALVLVGLPELLREFTEYRLLIYGAVLVFMMLARPEGLIPRVRRTRKLDAQELSQDAWLHDETDIKNDSGVALAS